MKRILLTVLIVSALLLSVGSVLAVGNGWIGYHDNNIFVGTGKQWCEQKYPTWTGCYEYLGESINDKITMKWNAEWDRGNAENWAHPPYDAWENNEWNGNVEGGSGAVWHYKIVWVGPEEWDVTGDWIVNFEYQDSYYAHDMKLTQTGDVLTGFGGYPIGGSYQYPWTITSGSVTGSQIHMTMIYTAGVPLCTMTMDGTIDSEGKINGIWSDDCWGLSRTGTWTSTDGIAVKEDGVCWREGGYRIWGQFEVIMDQGTSDGVHEFLTHAIPNGYGA